MRVFLLVILCALAYKDVAADVDQELKRGAFAFMAFLYYPDETVMDITGARFSRSGVLISNDWVLSTSDVAISFPQKTLVARAGAVNIDNKFTINEDEDEQEREIIVILRPYNYNVTEWWSADISLLKTLLPFNMTASVSSVPVIGNIDNTDKTCFILLYARQLNTSDRYLTQMYVDLLPPSLENCGNYFKKDTMICANDSNEKSNSIADPNYCQGNGGGPLLCENHLIGLQTYVKDCKPPHIYQFLTGWKSFITCAMDERYSEESCADICVPLNKDPPSTSTQVMSTSELSTDATKTSDVNDAASETLYTPSNNDQSSTTISTEDEPASTNEDVISKPTSTARKAKKVVHNTTISTTYSHDTTEFTSTDGIEATDDSTEERERKSHIEAHHALVHGDASSNVPSIFHYLLSPITFLAFT